eukprot:m.83521 g.83521  ORF g.83521 m.83521 type:complete len:1207 (+) comp14769_c0_seq1:504-4124(+)
MPLKRGNSMIRGSGHSLTGNKPRKGSIVRTRRSGSFRRNDGTAVYDLVLLTDVSENGVVDNITNMYSEDMIYSYIGNVVIAVNPFADLKIYNQEHIDKYRGRSAFDPKLPPHIFALADNVFSDLRYRGSDQVVIISGESGSGKTESSKKIMQYVAAVSGSTGKVDEVKSRLLATNPVLEAFGNAKTVRNDNSSRFGKYMDIQFDFHGEPAGGFITTYLLEKGRVIRQAENERNFHIFYQLLASGEAQKLGLSSDPNEYHYLKQGGSPTVSGMNDSAWFKEMQEGLNFVGFPSDAQAGMFQILAAIILLGEVEFKDAGNNTSKVAKQPPKLAELLGATAAEVENALTHNTVIVNRQQMASDLDAAQAVVSRDALAKAMYEKLFQYVYTLINKNCSAETEKVKAVIGVLDIYGFEILQNNSFEQFCINYCNEKLQQFFNVRVLKDEQELYVKESIKFKPVEFVDNQDCIDLIEAKKTGILAMLDEESKVPRADDKTFTDKLHKAHKDHFRLQLPRKSKIKKNKELRDNEGFIVRHFAGAVCYRTTEFLHKNNDALTPDLAELMDSSKDPFTRALFETKEGEAKPQRGKLTLISLGDKFKKALNLLMEKLESTRSSFIRCIKPNQKQKPKIFTGGEILSQLQCAGMVSVLDLMQGGFPSRTSFSDLHAMYKAVLPPALADLEPRTFCKALFKALGLNEDDFQFGVSKVFFRPGKFSEFDTIMKSDPENLTAMVGKVLQWLVKQRWKKIAWATVSCLKFAAKIRARAGSAILMQKVIRMFLARRIHKPRYEGIKVIRQLSSQLDVMNEVVDKLTKNKEKMQKTVADLHAELDGCVNTIKGKNTIERSEIEKMRGDMQAKMDKQLAALKKEQEKQKLAEEAERLRRIAEEMEAERKRKEQEEADRKAQEQEATQMKLMEEQQKKEREEEEKRLERERIAREKEESSTKVQAKKKEEEEAMRAEQARLEQERRDQELAMRLAQDQANPMEALTEDAQKVAIQGQQKRKAMKRTHTFQNKKQEALHKKHDLSKWKYADLRDTINTSCDIDLLEACREEFHRRLKVYHAWKMKNAKKSKDEGGRAPTGLREAAASRSSAPRPPAKKKSTERPQRYFRIPFIRPGDQGKKSMYKKKGWWFAHFDGQWIARQMELHPDKPPVLLVAGKDDMEMCELSLDETGLSRKRGAEILPREFEEEWKRNGGSPYEKAAPKKK